MQKSLSITFIKNTIKELPSGGDTAYWRKWWFSQVGNDFERGITENWVIRKDYLTDEKSEFVVSADLKVEQGMLCVASETIEELGSSWIDEYPYHPWRDSIYKDLIVKGRAVKPLFVGVVDTIEVQEGGTQRVDVRDIVDIFDFDGLLGKGSGTDLLHSMYTNIQNNKSRLPMLDNGQMWNYAFIEDDKREKITWTYQPNDPPAITNMRDYVLGMFKRYSSTLEAFSLVELILKSPDPSVKKLKRHVSVITRLTSKASKDKLTLKNNTSDFLNWNLYITPGGVNSTNAVMVIDELTTSGWINGDPQPEGWHGPEMFILTEDGEILNKGTVGVSDNVRMPLTFKIKKLDYSQEDHATPTEVAHEELSVSQYQHEISFDLDMDSALLKFSDFELGAPADLVHNGTYYSSILSGYEFNNSSRYITLKFGNVRSSLQAVFDDMNK